jgi:DNA-binding transcriptional LysR family regulator
MIDSLSELTAFVRVVETGGFTAAARSLDVSTALVSKQVSALETKLGVRLLDRNTRSSKPTELGAALDRRGVAILQALKDAEAEVTAQQTEVEGTLRVTLPPEFATLHLAPLLPAFQAQHPRLDLRLNLSSRVVDLIDDGQDMAVRFMRRYHAALSGRPLGRTRIILVASPSYLQSHAPVTHPDEVAGHRGLVYGGPDPWTEFPWTSASGAHGVMRLDPRFVATSTVMLCEAAIHGQGLAVTTTMVAGAALRRGDLVQVLPNVDFGDMTAWAVYPHRQHMPARLRVWLDFLRAAFGPDPTHDPFLHGLNGASGAAP